MSTENEYNFKRHGIWIVCLSCIGFLYNLWFRNITYEGYVNFGLMDERRNSLLYFGLGILVGVILIAVGTIKNEIRPPRDSENTRKCPFCAESIHIDATICKHCKSSISNESENVSEELNKSKETTLMEIHELGLTLKSDEIEFLRSRGKVL